MIEINLIPDVKLELLKARTQRKMVISASILVALIAGGLVVLMVVYAFGVQTVADTLADNGIKDEYKKLQQVDDLGKTLTIQKQLDTISSTQSDKAISSRLFDLVSATVPQGKNAVSIKRIALNAEDSTISIEAEATNGYEALEVFKKTIEQTKFRYTVDGKAEEVKIADSIAAGERNYSEDGRGNRILRFSLSFTYPDELLTSESQDGRIVGPDRQQATDSAQGVPTSLFNNGGAQ